MKHSSKWIIALVIVFGIFMSLLDQTIVTIAIPQLQQSLRADLQGVQWVATAYLLTQAAIIPTTAFLSALLGNKRLYLLSLCLFTLGSALCAAAWSLPALIIFRIIQGIGGAYLFPLSMTMLLQAFPREERGVAMSIQGIPVLVAPALGPVIGGALVTYASWRIIFLINIPIGILTILLSILLLHDTQKPARVRFDLPGFLSAAYGLSAVLYACSRVSSAGWADPLVLIFLLSGGLSLILFVALELALLRRGKTPLLNLRLFQDRSFSAGSLALVFMGVSLFSVLFLLPIYLQTLRGETALQAGLLLLPQALGMMVSILLAGRIIDRLGDARFVALPGLVLMALSLWLFTNLSLTTPYWQFGLYLALFGLSLGMVGQPLVVGSMVNIRKPEALANGTTLLTVTRSVSASVGTAVLATLAQTRAAGHYAQLLPQATQPLRTLHLQATLLSMHDVFVITALLALSAFLIGLLLQKKRPDEQEQSTAEPSARREDFHEMSSRKE